MVALRARCGHHSWCWVLWRRSLAGPTLSSTPKDSSDDNDHGRSGCPQRTGSPDSSYDGIDQYYPREKQTEPSWCTHSVPLMRCRERCSLCHRGAFFVRTGAEKGVARTPLFAAESLKGRGRFRSVAGLKEWAAYFCGHSFRQSRSSSLGQSSTLRTGSSVLQRDTQRDRIWRHAARDPLTPDPRMMCQTVPAISRSARMCASKAALPGRDSDSHITRRASLRSADAVLSETTYPARINVLTCFDSVASETSRAVRRTAKSSRSTGRRSPQIRKRSGACMTSSKRASPTAEILGRGAIGH